MLLERFQARATKAQKASQLRRILPGLGGACVVTTTCGTFGRAELLDAGGILALVPAGTGGLGAAVETGGVATTAPLPAIAGGAVEVTAADSAALGMYLVR